MSQRANGIPRSAHEYVCPSPVSASYYQEDHKLEDIVVMICGVRV